MNKVYEFIFFFPFHRILKLTTKYSQSIIAE